ncbi:MAG: hypothetical protein J0G96_07580 [Flavobacteriia bacterium]|nr:hypothetical protein [Flavobacteriia bacterium]OJX36921.1 MAG: hypothetical protein BGO87_14150 [Flavobacteriia bacterium 40-80]
MNFVIPMAGRGQRFVDAGFKTPKMLIEAKGKSLLEWSIDSLPLELCTNLIFVLLKEHAENHKLDSFVTLKYKKYNPKFVYLDEVTRGQAETVLKAKHLLDMSVDLVIYNIDTAFNSVTLHNTLINNKKDGVIGAFVDLSDSSKYSYAKLDGESNVTEVVEKVKISDFALTGFYHFTNPEDFISLAEMNIQNNNTVKGEYYVAPIYNQLLEKGKNFVIDICQSIDVLGTPEELISFKNA